VAYRHRRTPRHRRRDQRQRPIAIAHNGGDGAYVPGPQGVVSDARKLSNDKARFRGNLPGDANDDRVVNNQDIAPFVSLLTGLRPSATPTLARAGKRLVSGKLFAERALELQIEPDMLTTTA
jgi:hypothetical protein